MTQHTTYHAPQPLGTHTCAHRGCNEDTRHIHTTTSGDRIGYCKLHAIQAALLFRTKAA